MISPEEETFARIAQELGFVTALEMSAAIDESNLTRDGRLLGQILVQRGILDEAKLQKIRRARREREAAREAEAEL